MGEWRIDNARERYPFSPLATLTNGDITIPDDVFVSAKLHFIGGDVNQYISTITKDANSVVIHISDSSKMLGSGTLVDDYVWFTDSYGRAGGILVLSPGGVNFINALTTGEHNFSVRQTQFTVSAVVPLAYSGLTSVVAEEDANIGNVWFVGGSGVTVTLDAISNNLHRIYVHAVGDPLHREKLCVDAGAAIVETRAAETIGGIYPDEHGDIKFTLCNLEAESPVIRINNGTNEINIEALASRLDV